MSTTITDLKSHHFFAALRTVEGRELWSADQLLQAVRDCVSRAKLTAVNDVTATFQPQGCSAVVVLEESHVAVHLWPEKQIATVDIHVCDYSGDNEHRAATLAQLLGSTFTNDDSLSFWTRVTI